MNRRAGRADRQDGGYVLVVMAMLMVTLLIFAAFVIDVGALYSRTNKLQAAADAAALAAVVHLPGPIGPAQAAALDAAAANGVRPGGDISITVTPDPDSYRRVKVEIRDKLQPFFGKVVVDSFSMTRSARAEYSPTIPVGSPINVLGGPGENMYLAINGACTAKEDGDRMLSMYEQNRHNAWPPPPFGGSYSYSCNHGALDEFGNGGIAPLRNTDYNNTGFNNPNPTPLAVGGYNYLIHVACSTPIADPTVPCPASDTPTSSPIVIQGYDWTFNPNAPGSEDRQPNSLCSNGAYFLGTGEWHQTGLSSFVWDPAGTAGKCGMTTTFNLFKPDATPNNYTDDVRLGVQRMTRGNSAASVCMDGIASYFSCPAPGDWNMLFVIPAGSPRGNYRLQVRNNDNEFFSLARPNSYEPYGSNSFGLRAYPLDTGFVRCTLGSPCPVSVSGDGTMSLFAKTDQPSAELYLARLSPASEFRGKQVVIQLWDPGEGGQSIEVLAPGAASGYPVRATLAPPGVQGVSSDNTGWSASVTSLDVSGNVPIGAGASGLQVDQNHRGGQGKFNGRLVNLTMNIASNYGLDVNGNEVALADDGWWKIRYNFGAGVQDRTTWTVARVGNPVHLVE